MGVLLRVEALVEGQERPGPFEAVSGHLQLGHGVDVDDPELCGRTPGDVGGPQVQVPLLPAFEEEALVAILHLSDLVDDEERLLVPPHLALALRVRHQRLQVLHLKAANHVLEVSLSQASAESVLLIEIAVASIYVL